MSRSAVALVVAAVGLALAGCAPAAGDGGPAAPASPESAALGPATKDMARAPWIRELAATYWSGRTSDTKTVPVATSKNVPQAPTRKATR